MHCATSRTVPGSIPGGVTGDFFRGSSRQNHVPQSRLSLWKWVPGISPGVKAVSAFGWWPTTLVVLKVEKIRGLNLPGTPWATSACRGIPLLFFLLFIIYEFGNNKAERWTKKSMKWGRMDDWLVKKGGRKSYIMERNGRRSCEWQGIITFCTRQWNEWIICNCAVATFIRNTPHTTPKLIMDKLCKITNFRDNTRSINTKLIINKL